MKDRKILILQRHKNEDIYPNKWELPSGKREFLESSEISLLREIKEETGFDVIINRPFAVFDYQIEKEDEIRDSTQINYLVEVKDGSGRIKLSKEHGDYAWIVEGELNRYDFSDDIKRVLHEAFKIIKS